MKKRFLATLMVATMAFAMVGCSTDGAAIQEAIRNTVDHKGIQGNISIDPETGEYQGDVMIVQANEDGKWTYLDSASTTSEK